MILRISASLLLVLLSITFSNAQTYRVENAITKYNQDSLSRAIKEISYAQKHSRTSQYPKTWYWSYLINLELLIGAISDEDSTKYLNDLQYAYSQCRISSTASTVYLDSLSLSFEPLMNQLQRTALAHYENENYDLFLKYQLQYIDCEIAFGKIPGESYFLLASGYYEEREFEKAIDTYSSCIDNNYRVEDAMINRINLYYKIDQHDNADIALAEALLKYPKSNKLLYIEIYYFLDHQLHFKARTKINEYLALDKNNAELYYLEGRTYQATKFFEEAELSYDKAAGLGQKNVEINLKVASQLCEIYVETNNDELISKAISYLEKAESMDSNNELILTMLSDLYIKTRDAKSFQRIDDKLYLIRSTQ
ncbi:MAG: hypothetical protein JXR07_14760 [Reichenbachiella sp.]